ncbi:MAG: CBS domain-containing protein [Chloroflexi bacterium]|nr:CBS domain-containing protein [Chloroflexota bacterium]MBI3340056.1 CBS domain-containing protein [Chloroflexota bacterium]
MAQYVREIMTKSLVTVEPDDSVESALQVMRARGTHSVLIRPPRGGRLWRIFTDTDFLIALDSGNDPNVILVGTYASPITHTARSDWTIEKAREEMINAGVKHLPVMDGSGSIVGMVSITDVLNQY